MVKMAPCSTLNVSQDIMVSFAQHACLVPINMITLSVSVSNARTDLSLLTTPRQLKAHLFVNMSATPCMKMLPPILTALILSHFKFKDLELFIHSLAS